MACIYKRKDLGSKISWRVVFRRKGYPTFCLSFKTEKRARKWAAIHEPLFLQKPTSYYEFADKISLFNRRQQEIEEMISSYKSEPDSTIPDDSLSKANCQDTGHQKGCNKG